jgi:CRISPR-associated protein Cmr2
MTTPTLSGGVVIAHHLTPLEDVLVRAREAERWAKEREGKHTLAMVLLRRSGEAARVRDTWPGLLSHVQSWVEFSRQGAIPQGLSYALNDLGRFLEGTDLPGRAVSAEVRRMFKQKRENKDKKLWENVEHFVSGRLPDGSTMKDTLAVLFDMASEMRMAEEVVKVLRLSRKDEEGSA